MWDGTGEENGTGEDTAWCTLESDRWTVIRTHKIMIRGGSVILHMDVWSHCFRPWDHCTTEKPACQPCLPACLLLILLQNNHPPHTARLNSSRNHIRLIDKGLTSIYRNSKQSQRQRIHPQSRLNHIQIS